MAHAPAQYRLVVFDELEDPRPLRDLFCQVLGVHPTDAAQWVARVPGVWPKLLGEADVRRLLDGLYALEIAAEAWRVDAFPDLRRPRTIHEAACLDGGLRISGLRGEPTHWVPWDKVEMLAAGTIAADDDDRAVTPPGWVNALSTGFRAAIGRAPRGVRRPRTFRAAREPVPEVLIVRRDPLVAFRVIANQMNYGYLGDRLRPSAVDNFPLFLADLRRLATRAIVTPTTDDLLHPDPEAVDPDDHEFGNQQALIDYATLRLLWGWYRRDREKLEGTDEHRQIS